MATASGPSSSASRRRRRRLFTWVAILAVVGAAGAYAAVNRPWEVKPKLVAVETVAPGPVTQILAVNGRVAAREDVTLRSSVSALVADVLVAEGDLVEAGAVLLRLDDQQARAVVDQARAALEQGKVRQKQAEAAAERARALGENTSRSNREDTELASAAAGNEVARLQAALEQAESQLDKYTITAPLGGTILTRPVARGQLVDSQTELMTIADLGELVVETDVDELFSSHMRKGLKALLMPAGETVARQGTVAFAAPKVDPSTGGRAIRIAFDVPADLPVGLTVNANIVVEELTDALSVPRGALIIEGSETRVLVVADGVAATRQITFDDWPADRVVVTSGLAAGDRVIVDPSRITPGLAVTAE